jgi:hypothetical protein
MLKNSVFYVELNINPTFFYCITFIKYQCLNLLIVLTIASLMAGSTTGVSISPWYGDTKPQCRRLTTKHHTQLISPWYGDTKPQCRRLTTKHHTQQPVTTPLRP